MNFATRSILQITRKKSAMVRPFTFFLLTTLLTIGCGSTPAAAQEKAEKSQAGSIAERLPSKIQQIQKELPAWLEKTGNKDALALMQKLGEQVKAKRYEEAETSADTLLKLMGVAATKNSTTAVSGGDKKPGAPASNSADDATKRLTEKVERVKAGAQKWAASGNDPSEIFKTMQEKFQPLMAAGKVAEAEVVLDSVLKKLDVDVKTPNPAPASQSSAEERVLTKIHLIQKERPEWIKKTDKQAESDAMMKEMKKQLADMNFAAADKTADAILKLMGVSIAPAAHIVHAERPATTEAPKQAADPFAAFLPQQLVFLASDRIALTAEQRDTLQAKVNTTQPRLEELKTALASESAALVELTSTERLDETAILAQLNKFLDVERESKQLQASLGVTIQNLLTSEQMATLRELGSNPDAIAKLEQDFKNRIMTKIELITAGAQTLAQSGRDPAFISQAMEQKVRPLMDSGRAFEAEIEIDRVLEQLKKESK